MKFKKYIDKFDKEQILKLNKEGNNIQKISKIIGIPSRRLSDMINYFDLKLIKNFSISVDHDYFNNIDSEYKAYILGYTIADGCVRVTKRKKNYSYRLCYFSSIDDLETITLIQKEISKESKINFESNKDPKVNRKDQIRLRFSSKNLVNTLIDKYQVTPNKTTNKLEANLPNVGKYQKHLLRGLFDGDGWVNKTTLGFCLNSKNMCKDIIRILKDEIPEITYRLKEVHGKTCVYYKLLFNMGKGVRNKIYDYFYLDSTHHLSRKEIKFKNTLIPR